MTVDQDKLRTIIDLIIPHGPEGEPAASESRTARYIQDYLEGQKGYAGKLTALLENIAGGDLSEKGLKDAEAGEPETFRRLVEMVYSGYYGDPEIVKALDLPGPPQPGGHSMEPFNRTPKLKS